MTDALATELVDLAEDTEIRTILSELCATTGMGFAAVARVTEKRWIACQVEDKIDFGLDPGNELKIKQTICDEVRDCREPIIIDDVTDDPDWSRHPVPILYGFKSYASMPLILADGSFFGTLCAIDPEAHDLHSVESLAMFQAQANRVTAILSHRARGSIDPMI